MAHLLHSGLGAASSFLFLLAPLSAQSADADLAPPLVRSGPLLVGHPAEPEPVPPGGFAPLDMRHRILPWTSSAGDLPDATLNGPESDLAGVPAEGFRRPSSIDASLERPLIHRANDDAVWVRTLRQRTRFGQDAVTVYPVFGPSAPDESPVSFQVVSAQAGSAPLAVAPASAPLATVDGSRVVLQRADFTESWNLSRECVEQTFVFDELPERGELSVTMSVTTDLEARSTGEALRFERAGLGGVSYGAAFAFDANGRRTPVARTFSDGSLTLTVPADFVADAVLPLTIDPPVTSWTLTGSFADDSSPDICFAGLPGQYFVVWEEYTSQTNADCYLTSFAFNGLQGSVEPIETGNDFWDEPQVAYVPANNRLLIVANVTPDGPGTGLGRVEGRLFDALNRTPASPIFPISTSGTQKIDAVVGGTNFVSLVNNYFVVAWSRVLSPTRYSIEYRIVDWDGTAVTPVEILTVEEGVQNIQLAVSASHGDTLLVGDAWTLAWVEKPAGSFFTNGPIKAARIFWSGQFFGNILTVNDSIWCTNPSVSSQLDSDYGLAQSRPSIVAYGVKDPSNGLRGDIFANVVSQNFAYPANPITAMEDFDLTLAQSNPAIASDGEAFVLAYEETFYLLPTGTNRNLYMNSGSVVRTGAELRIALAERHKQLSLGLSVDRKPAVAMARDGNASLPIDDGAVVWYRDLDNPGGQILGSGLDAGTDFGAPRRAVGRQYCDANLHSGNASQAGPDSSWLWIEGDQSVSAIHEAHCVEMPPDAFGFLICSLVQGNVNLPGGSSGRLCLGGAIGRYTDQIASSGAAATISIDVNPQALPQPNGFVAAAAGETWNFQLWHRDGVNGTVTSNFSNACSVDFR